MHTVETNLFSVSSMSNLKPESVPSILAVLRTSSLSSFLSIEGCAKAQVRVKGEGEGEGEA